MPSLCLSMSSSSIDFYNDAVSAVQAGKLPEALSAIESSLTEDPNDAQTWQFYVVVLDALGRTQDAAKATSKLKELGLDEADHLLMKAASAAGSGDLKSAIAHYEAAAELAPARAEIQAGLALVLMRCEFTADALFAARRAVAIDPDGATANYALGHVLRRTEKNEAALEALTKAVAADSEFLVALYEQGMLLTDAGRNEEALSNFEKFHAAQPEDPSAIQALAAVRQRLAEAQK